MKNNLKYIVAVLFITTIGFISCKKTEYSFGNIKTPTGLTLTAAVVGVDATNPNGNGTGSVTITAKATDALTYNIDFGDGKTQVIPLRINMQHLVLMITTLPFVLLVRVGLFL